LHRFGIPKTITTDQGSVFTSQKIVRFANQTGFKLLTSTPYYAQANGQVEAANVTPRLPSIKISQNNNQSFTT